MHQRVNEEDSQNSHGHEAFQLHDRDERAPASDLERTGHGREPTALPGQETVSWTSLQAKISPFTTARADLPEAAHLPVHSLLGDVS